MFNLAAARGGLADDLEEGDGYGVRVCVNGLGF